MRQLQSLAVDLRGVVIAAALLVLALVLFWLNVPIHAPRWRKIFLLRGFVRCGAGNATQEPVVFQQKPLQKTVDSNSPGIASAVAQ